MLTGTRKHPRFFTLAIPLAAVLASILLLGSTDQRPAPDVPIEQFVNFESAHVHPLDLTPDGHRLLAVNTANNSLEVFITGEGGLRHHSSIPVGLDPVSVRARNDQEAWVVNTISDEISIVDLTLNAVVRSLRTENEPMDVVFAGDPRRAFVSCAERESIQIFDLKNLDAPPQEVLLEGEQPRAMAVSPDGDTVYTAFFESGNMTTVVAGNPFLANGVCSEQKQGKACTRIPNEVTLAEGPYGGVAPVPNDGKAFKPPLNPALPAVESQSLVVRKDVSSGRWLDDNGGDWSRIVAGGGGNRIAGWDMPDRDVAVLDANSLDLSYHRHLGNILMAMAVNPDSGELSVVGTDASNEIRFEPNLNGRFLRVNFASVNPAGERSINDLNPQLDDATSAVSETLRSRAIGDPRGIAWSADGTQAYITGMGSNNVVTVNANGARTDATPLAVGEGPTGVVLHESLGLAYVLNRFDGSISSLDLASGLETQRTPFFDPTPRAIKAGRPLLYNTHQGSGSGHIACASCHVDARWDRLAWDLGNPAGTMETLDEVAFHPMKGLKTTPFLIDIIDRGTGNLHWRGDRRSIHEFADTFTTLQGLDEAPGQEDMQRLADFLAATWYVPNPYRSYEPERPIVTKRMNDPGRVRHHGTNFQRIPSRGGELFTKINQHCAHCHVADTGRGDLPGKGNTKGTGNIDMRLNRNMAPDLRSVYRKNGFFYDATEVNAGFGLMADGAFPTVFNNPDVEDDYFGDYEAELLSWSGGVVISPFNCLGCERFPLYHDSQDAAPGVGLRMTLHGAVGDAAAIEAMKKLADERPKEYGMVVKGLVSGAMRGFYYLGSGEYQSDVETQRITHTELLAAARSGSQPLAWTLVHPSTAQRIGVDRDADGVFDGDEP